MEKKYPEIVTKTMHITPDIALEWYGLSGGNRSIRPSRIDFLEGQMRTNWKLNGETIIFDWFGNLLDGHHRLVTSAERGVEFESVVTWGVDPKSRDTIDTGADRSQGDALSFAGKLDTNVLAVTLNRLIERERDKLSSASKTKSSNSEIVAASKRWPKADQSISAVRNCRKLMPITRMAWLHVLLVAKHSDRVTAFFDQLASGAELHEGHPILALRQRIWSAATGSRKIPLNENLALLVKAWNAFYKNKPVRILKWQASEPFPKIEGI